MAIIVITSCAHLVLSLFLLWRSLFQATNLLPDTVCCQYSKHLSSSRSTDVFSFEALTSLTFVIRSKVYDNSTVSEVREKVPVTRDCP